MLGGAMHPLPTYPLPTDPSPPQQVTLAWSHWRRTLPTFCVLGMGSAFSSLAGAATSARFSLVEAAELPFSSVSSSFSNLWRESGLRAQASCGAGSHSRL